MILGLRARWRASILICVKCEQKLDQQGFGPDGKQRLSKLLRKRHGGGKGRKAGIGVTSVKCLKVCPKNAVTVVDGTRPREWLVVQAGTPIEQIEARLGLTDPIAVAAE